MSDVDYDEVQAALREQAKIKAALQGYGFEYLDEAAGAIEHLRARVAELEACEAELGAAKRRIAELEGHIAACDVDLHQQKLQIDELRAESDKWQQRCRERISDLHVMERMKDHIEAENDRLRRGIGEIGLRFISGNSVPVERTTITLSEYEDWCDRMGLNNEGDA